MSRQEDENIDFDVEFNEQDTEIISDNDFDFSFEEDENEETNSEKDKTVNKKTEQKKENKQANKKDKTPKKKEKTKKENKQAKKTTKNKKAANSKKGKKGQTNKVTIKVLTGLGIALSVVVTISLSLNLLKSSNQHITIADKPPEIIEEQTSNDSNKENTSKENNEEIKETSTKEILSIGDKATVGLTVNTKIKENGDTSYRDYSTYINLAVNKVVVGYDKVIRYVDEYNNSSDNVVQLDNKEEFYKNYPDYELVMVNSSLSIPENFPTQDTEKGTTTLKPELSLTLQGTDKDNKDKIITDKYEYKIPKATSITLENDKYSIGSKYEYNWILILPKNITKDTYNIKLKYEDNNGTNKTYSYSGVDIQ